MVIYAGENEFMEYSAFLFEFWCCFKIAISFAHFLRQFYNFYYIIMPS